jgi:hypothetical protein
MPRSIRQPKKLRLYNALKIGYLRNEAKQQKRLKRFGYVLQKDLTTDKHLVAYNPTTKKVIFVSNGTDITSPADLYTDATGVVPRRLEHTARYESDYNAYQKAKKRFKDTPITLVGHSLGGGIVTELAKPDDRAITYNPANIYQKSKPNVYNYRTHGDPFSAFSRDTKTLSNPATGLQRLNPIQPHNVENIRDQPIFI